MVRDGVFTTDPVYFCTLPPRLILDVTPFNTLNHVTDVWVGLAVTVHSRVILFAILTLYVLDNTRTTGISTTKKKGIILC